MLKSSSRSTVHLGFTSPNPQFLGGTGMKRALLLVVLLVLAAALAVATD